MWTAATCSPETRRLFVNGLAYWLNFTSTSYPFTDLYETIDDGSYPEVPDEVTFKARPVVGGHFALLSLYRAGLLSSDAVGDNSGSVFAQNSTQAVSSEIILPTQASVDLGPAGSGKATQQPFSFSTLTTLNGTTPVTTTIASITETVTVSSFGVEATAI